MNSSGIGEPFQLYLGSALSQSSKKNNALYSSHSCENPGYATVVAQADGIHVWDIRNLHAIASYSVSKSINFARPAVSLYTTEGGSRSVVSYIVLASAPGMLKCHQRRTVWAVRQSLSGSSTATSEKSVAVIDRPPLQICGTGHDAMPLLFVSKRGYLSLADARVDIKAQLDWPGKRTHLQTFVFSRKSCVFIQDDTKSCTSAAVICCQSGRSLHVRLVLLGEDIVMAGTCEIPTASSIVLDLTCSPSGVLSFIDLDGVWATHQLASFNASLVSTPLSESFKLRRFAFINNRGKSARNDFSIVSLGTSLVLLAALVDKTEDISLQIWDLSYGVLLTAQSMPVPSSLPLANLSLTVADEGQVLLTVSSLRACEPKAPPRRSSIHIVPVDARLKSSLAGALGKMAQTAEWLAPNTRDSLKSEEAESVRLIFRVRAYLEKSNPQKAEQGFLKWVESQISKEAALGHEFVKKVLKIVLPVGKPTNYSYAPRIIRCLLENAVVSTIMLDGHLITALRQRGDWENLMFALTTVTDVSEDELMATAKFLVDRQHRSENAMDVDASEDYTPPLWSYLSACVSYSFSPAPMCLAIRKHLPDAQDLVVILEILENWMQGGTEDEIEGLFESLSLNTKIPSSVGYPPYPKVITFLQALLDASFVALLQYRPSRDVLHRILSFVEPEIKFIDSLEPLRGILEPFSKAQVLMEKTSRAIETPAEWKERRKQLEQRADLGVGLYRLEELVL